MFLISLDALLDKLNTSTSWYYIPVKYDPLLEVLRMGAPMMHPVYARLMESLEQDVDEAYGEARLFAYYQLAALELVAKYKLGLPIERLPLGHEALGADACLMALVWAAQFLAYCDGKEPFSIYNSEGLRVWAITDDNVEGQDFVEFFKIEASDYDPE